MPLQTAAVYVRPSGNAVLAEFDHGDSHSEIAPTTDHTWDTFIRLSAKVEYMAWAMVIANCLVQVITGGEGQPNYVLGQHGYIFYFLLVLSQNLLTCLHRYHWAASNATDAILPSFHIRLQVLTF
jgi:hypothetical protein